MLTASSPGLHGRVRRVMVGPRLSPVFIENATGVLERFLALGRAGVGGRP